MKITEIKNSLEITQVAEQLGIRIGKGDKAQCPFHPDKTPSLQFSKEKQIATCFSSNCNLGTVDVIGLAERQLQKNTHETLNYLKENFLFSVEKKEVQPLKETPNYHKDFEQMQSSFVSSSTARKYAESRNLDWKLLQIGYNAFKSSRFEYLRDCITFGLRDQTNQIVSMYGRSIRDNNKAKHYYTTNRTGLYPKYPGQETKKLILTESIIDAATLLSIAAIKSKYEVLALYGTNGLTAEIRTAITELEQLKELILWFDGDEAGRKAITNNGTILKELLPKTKISVVETLENEDINSLSIGHEPKVFLELLKNKTEFFLSVEKENATSEKPKQLDLEEVIEEVEQEKVQSTALNTSNSNKIVYTTETAAYYIKGGIRKDLDSLRVTLVIEHLENKVKSRNKLDLYEDKQTEKIARESAERLNLRADLIEQDLNILTDLLDQYRESVAPTGENETQKVIIPAVEKDKCFEFLKKPNLLQNINELIGKSGVVGEEKNRLFLFGIASTYKMENTLHALIQGTSGSGKTHLLATIMDFMPPEDTINLTRVTESSFYNYGEYELSNKLIGMEDFDGLEEKAEFAFRELMSKGEISSSTSGKNEHTGQIAAYIKTVFGPIASLSATTKGEIYEDNMSRCFLISVDESVGQTANIIKYQNNKAAGLIDVKKEKEIRDFLRNCMRLLQPLEVVNPYANKIELPKEAHKIRRLNDLFQSYVKQVTLLNQYQRNKDVQGRLITDKEDVKTAIEIMFDSIILKVDELDGSLRDFYEQLKKYVLAKGKEYEFEQREIRQQFRISKTQMQRHINNLLELEYIVKTYVSTRNTFHYKIGYWDNMEALRNRIKSDLNKQLDKL